MKIEDLCSGCSVLNPSKQHQAALVRMGDSSSTVTPVGKSGHYQEVTQSYKCPTCGAVWENLIESGAGGHGNFWNRIGPPQLRHY